MDSLDKSLCRTYSKFFPIGAAVSTDTIRTHEQILKKHFNSVTAENQMKFIKVHPEEGKWCFENADEIVKFAADNNMKVRGHTLMWHNQVPEWVFLDKKGHEVSRDVLLARVKEHIEVMVQRYKKQVYCWDVVNEAVEDKTSQRFRQSKWHNIIGPDLVAKAFEFARKANPDVLLFYNDYHTTFPEKRKKIYNLAKRLMDCDAGIDGIGMQGHWDIYEPSYDSIRDTIDIYASLGLKIQITELDMSVFASDNHTKKYKKPTDEMVWLQQERYEGVFKIFREYSDVITGVTLWGVADDHTWLDRYPVRGRKDWPLLFDMQHRAKKALVGVVNFE